jgi:hypothetical protein
MCWILISHNNIIYIVRMLLYYFRNGKLQNVKYHERFLPLLHLLTSKAKCPFTMVFLLYVSLKTSKVKNPNLSYIILLDKGLTCVLSLLLILYREISCLVIFFQTLTPISCSTPSLILLAWYTRFLKVHWHQKS